MKLSSLMTRDVMTISPEMTVKEAARELFEKKISGLPVVDKDGQVIVMITEKDLIAMALPQYLQGEGLQDFAYILDEEPFNKKILEADRILVKDIMRRDVTCVTEETPVPEVARLMLAKKVRRIPVVRNKKLIGIIARADIVREIARQAGII